MEDLYEAGGRVLAVFGPFGSRTLVEMPTEAAQELFPDGLAVSGRTNVVDAVEGDLEILRGRDAKLAASALAASALALAYEMGNPYNSATSKSMCARELRETMATLIALAPPKGERDGIDDIAEQRAKRRASAGGGPAA